MLRLMTVPNAQWPKPLSLNRKPANIRYTDSKGQNRIWDVELVTARQGASSVILDVFRLEDRLDVALRLDRITHMTSGDKSGSGIAVISQILAVTIQDTDGPTSAPLPIGALTGQRIVFTGQAEIISRASVRQLIEAAGGTMAGAISDETTILVCCGPEQVSDRKIAQAKQAGAKIISENEFAKMLEAQR